MDKLVSIVIPTINRKKELYNLLQSIKNIKYKNYEIIIVDQNPKGFLEEVINKFKSDFKILHLRLEEKGASRARNYGAKFSNGEILCFPDDDSEFFSSTIRTALTSMKKNNCKIVFGKTVDKNGNDSVISYKEEPGFLSIKNHKGMFVEATMFIEKNLFMKYKYDETFGVGSFYGAEEAYDLILRMLKNNEKIYYDPDILLYHPQKTVKHTSIDEIKRVFFYRCGFAHLCIKHNLYSKLIKRILLVSGYIVFLSIFNRKKIRYYIAELLGILTGIVVREKREL